MIIIWIWYCSRGGGGGSMPELAFVIQWPFLCSVFSLHSLFPHHPLLPPIKHIHPHTHIHTASLQHAAIIRGPVYVYISNILWCVCVYMPEQRRRLRIEIARVRKALSRAFYNCCYYHLIKILRTLFLRLFDTHARTHTHTHMQILILYTYYIWTSERPCECVRV